MKKNTKRLGEPNQTQTRLRKRNNRKIKSIYKCNQKKYLFTKNSFLTKSGREFHQNELDKELPRLANLSARDMRIAKLNSYKFYRTVTPIIS